jgi:hypothetical protein
MAVRKGTSRTKSRLASGIHQVASKAKDVTPVPTKTRRFEQAKKTLTPFIQKEDRGDDQVEVIDVSAAIQSGTNDKTLKDLGVSTAKIKEAKQTVEDVEEAPTTSLAVPTPTPKPAPKPGKKLKVDKNIKDAAKEMRFAATQIVGGTGFIGSADISLANKAVALDTVVRDVEQGNLTNAEAKDRVAQIQGQPSSGPLSDALYVVPGYGTFLSYQDARASGWSPVETGFFAASAAADALLFFSPIKKAGGAVTRVTVNTPKKVLGKLPIVKAEKAFADSTVLTPREQAFLQKKFIRTGKFRDVTDPAFGTGRPKVTATVEAPTTPKTRPKTDEPLPRTDPGPVRIEPSKPRTRPDRLDPEEAPTVKPRPKTDEPLPKPKPLDDPLVIPSPTPVPDQPPSEEPERVFEFQPDPSAVEVQSIPIPAETTEVQSETRTETSEVGSSGTKTQTGSPGTRFEGFPRDFPFAPGTGPVEDTETKTPSKTKPETQTQPETITDPLTEPGGGSRTKDQPQTSPETATDTFTETTIGGGQTKDEPQTKPEPVKENFTDSTLGGGQTKDEPQTRPETQPEPKPEQPKPGPGPEPLKPQPRPDTTKMKTPLPDFELPEGVKRIPKGFFPKVVTWPQGAVQITYDLTTGTTTYKGRTPDKKSPRDGFTVTRLTRTPPPPRILDMGVTDALVTTGSIRFRRSRSAKASKDFRRSRGRL